MEFIKRYVYAVTRRLPEKQRNDVSRELVSDIEAMVSDKAGDKKPTEKHIKDVLKELGDPVVFARQYDEGKKYLIGPLFFDTYLTLLKTILYIVPPVVAVITLVSGLLGGVQAGQIITNTLGAAIEVGVHIFFWVTLIFVLLERSGAENIEKTGAMKTQAWTPDDLPELPSGNRIPKGDAISGIVWSAVCTFWVLWQVPAVHAILPFHTPLFFSDQMWPYWTLTLLVIAAMAVIIEIIRLVKGVWTLFVVSLVTIVNSLLIIYVLAVAAFVRPIVSEDFIQKVAHATGRPELMDIITVSGVAIGASIIIVSLHEIVASWRKYKKTEG